LAMVGLERNFEGKYQPCQNFHYQQELGALMMPVSLLAMLETGKAKLSDEVNTGSGVYPVDNERVMLKVNHHTYTTALVASYHKVIGGGSLSKYYFTSTRLKS